jgi:hypothetical protein
MSGLVDLDRVNLGWVFCIKQGNLPPLLDVRAITMRVVELDLVLVLVRAI